MIPFFSSEYSIGESILTLKPPGKSKPTGPKSILDIAKKLELQEVFLVENSMAGFLTAYKNFKDAKIKLCFGLKLVICRDVKDKSDPSRNTESKVIIFLRNSGGYSNLVKIWNRAATDNFYYYPRVDAELLKTYWNNDSFLLVFPFYSSFLARNSLSLSECIVDHSFTAPILTLEDSGLPFDFLIKNRVVNYAKENDLKVEKVRSIYYDRYDDILPYTIFRCIQERTTLDKPNLNHFASNKFCVEEYVKQRK